MAETALLRSFNFRIALLGSAGDGSRLGDGGFQECSGLEVELEIKEFLEGGNNAGVIRQVGRAKYAPLVLKRGMFHPEGGSVNRELWQWIQGIAEGVRPVRRYNGTVTVLSVGQEIGATWQFDRGLPMKVSGPQLNAKTGEVAIEELHIAHEGLRLVAS